MHDLFSKLYFKIKLYESHGMIFQDLFNKLMYHIDDQFNAIIQYGGDGGCDGYSPELNIHFAITTQVDQLEKKFENDFNRYLAKPKSDFFVFVYGKPDMNFKLSDEIQKTQRNNPNITIKHWGFNQILNKYLELDIEKRMDLLGDFYLPLGNIEDSITHIIIKILEEANKSSIRFNSIATSTITELSSKLNNCYLSDVIKQTANYTAPKEFFDSNPTEKEVLRQYIDSQYLKLKQDYDDADIIVFKVMENCYKITELNFSSLLSIISVFIEDCTLLENTDAIGE